MQKWVSRPLYKLDELEAVCRDKRQRGLTDSVCHRIALVLILLHYAKRELETLL